MSQMSQECLTTGFDSVLPEGEVPLLLRDLSESASDSLASSEEKSLAFEDLSQDELVEGVVDSELSSIF